MLAALGATDDVEAGRQVGAGQAGERAESPRMRELALVDPVRPGAVPVMPRQPGQMLIGERPPVQVRAVASSSL